MYVVDFSQKRVRSRIKPKTQPTDPAKGQKQILPVVEGKRPFFFAGGAQARNGGYSDNLGYLYDNFVVLGLRYVGTAVGINSYAVYASDGRVAWTNEWVRSLDSGEVLSSVSSRVGGASSESPAAAPAPRWGWLIL